MPLGFWPEYVELVSPLTREECVRRLRESVDSEWALFGSRPLIGRVDDSSFKSRQRKRYRNSFQTYLRAALEDEGHQTRIRCHFGMHPLVTAFMIFWFSIVLLGTNLPTLAWLANGGGWEVLALPACGLLMVGLGFGLVSFGRFLARGEQVYLQDFLQETLEAHTVNG